MRAIRSFVAAALMVGGAGLAHAQSTAGAGSVIVVPLLAETASYTSEVTVYNPNPAPITVNMTFYEGNSATPGPKTCSSLTLASLESKPFAVADPARCGPLAAGGHFGMLVIEDAAAQKRNVFFAYARTQTPGGNGFSAEGIPIGEFSGAEADVVGLKRQAAAPVYQSNCFVAALSEGLNYQMLLYDAAGNIIGSKSDPLQPFQMVRLLDVFAEAGAAPGDHSNVRANFTVQNGPSKPALVSFCTVQESTFFGADFRIAKSHDALNNGRKRLACIGQDDCGLANPVGTLPETISVAEAALRRVYSMIITQPDYVRCDLVAAPADLANLQIRLREPGDPFGSAVFVPDVGDAGGAGETTFYIYTGGRNAIDSGTATRWFIDVETRTQSTSAPINFGITCTSGNGVEVPWFRGTTAYATPF